MSLLFLFWSKLRRCRFEMDSHHRENPPTPSKSSTGRSGKPGMKGWLCTASPPPSAATTSSPCYLYIANTAGKITTILQAGVTKRVGISQFRFKNIQWQYCSYIVCKYDQDRSSNPRNYEGYNCTFLDEMAKIGIFHQIFQQLLDWSSLTFSLSSHIYGDYKNWHKFCRSLRNIAMVITFMAFFQTSKLTTFTLCSGVRKRIGLSLSGFRMITGRWLATLCKNLVNIGPVTLEFNKEICEIFAVTRLQNDDRPTFGLWCWNSDFSSLIGHYFSTSCEILVRFGSVTPDFKAIEVLRLASIIVTTLNLLMFAKGWGS